MRRLNIVLFILALTAMGCAPSTTSSSELKRWVAGQGGVIVDIRQARVDTVAARLLRGCGGLNASVQILANNVPCAYGWPLGELFITRGLLDRVDDHELAAALAHEMGHLLGDGCGGGQIVVSLRGFNGELDMEQTADLIGVELLRRQAIPGRSMITMLKKVCASGTLSEASRLALDRRIERLQDRLVTP